MLLGPMRGPLTTGARWKRVCARRQLVAPFLMGIGGKQHMRMSVRMCKHMPPCERLP